MPPRNRHSGLFLEHVPNLRQILTGLRQNPSNLRALPARGVRQSPIQPQPLGDQKTLLKMRKSPPSWNRHPLCVCSSCDAPLMKFFGPLCSQVGDTGAAALAQGLLSAPLLKELRLNNNKCDACPLKTVLPRGEIETEGPPTHTDCAIFTTPKSAARARSHPSTPTPPLLIEKWGSALKSNGCAPSMPSLACSRRLR